MSYKNMGISDRIIRALLGVGLLQAGYFWLIGPWQITAYAAGAVMAATAIVGICPLYRIFGVSSMGTNATAFNKTTVTAGILLVLAVAIGGSVASNFFTRKTFLEDFNAMNDAYKQTLFSTGTGERQKAVIQYDRLLPAYQTFKTRYLAYQPHALRNDRQLASDLQRVADIFSSVNGKVRTGNLNQAHLELEAVRSVWQNMFKRNGFSMLSVTLVDFHDDMELMLKAANAKDADELIKLYPQVDEKLKAVETEANDLEIQVIRRNLDDLLALAKNRNLIELPAKGEILKSSFVKVYLIRG